MSKLKVNRIVDQKRASFPQEKGILISFENSSYIWAADTDDSTLPEMLAILTLLVDKWEQLGFDDFGVCEGENLPDFSEVTS